MKRVIDTINQFFTSSYFIGFIGLVTLFSWIYEQEFLGIVLFVLLVSYSFITNKNTLPVAGIAIFIPFIFSEHFAIASFSNWLIPTLFLAAIGLTVHIIRFKPKFKNGRFSLGLVGLVLGFFTMGLFFDGDRHWTLWAVGVVVIFLFAVLYYFFNNTIEELNTNYLAKVFFTLGMIIVIQVCIYYYRQPDLMESMRVKSLEIGWGISNAIATVLLLTIPITGYLITTTKKNILYIIGFTLQILTMFFTFSRGGVLILLLLIIPIIVFITIKSKHLLSLFLKFTLMFFIVLYSFLILMEPLIEIFEPMITKGFDDSARIALYLEAFQNFKEYPLFGTGLFYKFEVKGKIFWYHNTILQMASSKGLVGLVAMGIHFFEKYKNTFKKSSTFSIFLLFALFMTDLHGMIDVTYYALYYVVPLIFVLILLEKNDQISSKQNNQANNKIPVSKNDQL